jgi:hypothetical protein
MRESYVASIDIANWQLSARFDLANLLPQNGATAAPASS